MIGIESEAMVAIAKAKSDDDNGDGSERHSVAKTSQQAATSQPPERGDIGEVSYKRRSEMTVRSMDNGVLREFPDAELLLLLDATNGSVFTVDEPGGISAACYVLTIAGDAIKLDNFDAKWGVSADAFLAS